MSAMPTVNKNARSFPEDSTAELLSDSEDKIVWNLKIKVDHRQNICLRYRNAVKNIIGALSARPPDEIYELEPIAIGSASELELLEKVESSAVDTYYVKLQISQNTIWVVDLVVGKPHATGVSSGLVGPAFDWNKNNGNRYNLVSNGNILFANQEKVASGAPDIVLQIGNNYRDESEEPHSVAIIELEISNRDLTGMRRDYLAYFNDEALVTVIGIKFFKTDDCAVHSGVAIQWSRGADGVIDVVAVFDFGFKPIGRDVQRSLAENLENALPPVPANLWADNRHAPVAAATLIPPLAGGVLTARAAVRWITCNEDNLFATSTTPRMFIPGARLTAALRNLPANVVLQDFVLDLGTVLYWVARGSL